MKEKGFYRDFFHSAPFACAHHEIITRADGGYADYRFIDVNEAFEKLSGYNWEMLSGKVAREFFSGSASSEQGWRTIYDRIADEDGTTNFEHTFGFSDKRFAVSAYLTDASHLAVVLKEVVPFKHFPEPDILKDGQWQAFWDNDLFGVMVADRNGHYIDVNNEACRMTGFSRDELRSMNLFDLIDPEQVKEARTHFEQIGSSGRAYGEVAYYTKGGEKRWWNVVGARFSDDYFIAFHEDITGRKHVEEALRESLKLSDDILKAIPSGFFIYRHEAPGRLILLSANPEAERLTGINSDQWVGREFNEIWPDAARQGITAKYLEVLQTGIMFETEDLYYSDQRISGAFRIHAFKLPENRLAVAFENITKRKQAEDALRLREERLVKQNSALLTLMSRGTVFQSDLQQAISEITELSGTLVETERVSVWLYNEDFSEIRCINLNQAARQQNHGKQEVLRCEDFPGYFASQKNGDVIAAKDVFTDPRTRELPSSYYKEHNICSMLDTPVWFHDRLGAVLCFEHTGEQREWTTEDVRLATTMAALLSIIFQNDDRKKTEEALRQNRNMLDTILNSIPHSVFWKDRDSRYIGCNMQFARAAGFEYPGMIIGKTDFDLSWPNDEALAYYKDDQQVMSDNFTRTHIIEPLQHADGTRLWIDTTKIPLLDNKGDVYGVLGIYEDITENLLAQEELAASEKKYQELSTLLRLMADNMPDLLWAKNLKKEYIFANKALCDRLLNASDTSEPLGKTDMFFAMRERDSRPENPGWHTFGEICRDSDSITLQEMKPMQFDEFGNVKGTFLFLDVHKAPLYDDRGQLIGVVGSARDVTAAREELAKRKSLEENLKHQSRLRDLLMEISSGFINIPLEKVNESVNDALAKMAHFVVADRAYCFDYDWDGNVCNNTYEWCGEGIYPQIDQLQGLPIGMIPWWIDLHKKGEPVIINDIAELDASDGARQILEPQEIKSLISVPMMDNSQCIGFIGFDYVREQHICAEAELHLLEIFAQLLTNVKLRKEMVEQYVAAKAKAEESDRLKTHFMNNISHEIRTPLNSIVGFGDLIMDERLSPDKKQYYHHILQQSSHRLQQTVTDIMDIAQLKTGSLRKTIRNMNIRMVLARLTDGIRYACSRKNIVVSLEFPSGSETTIIRTDEEMFSKAMQHLLDNAVKFTRSGRITVGFSDQGNMAECFVKDTGQGISPGKLESVFEPFMQEDVRSTRGHEGSGLGLAIVRGLAQLLGGHIRAESEKGSGSAFYLSVPLDQAEPGSEAPEIPAGGVQVSGNPVILIAEDDESGAQLIQVIVQMAGFQTLHAWNGEEAIDFCLRYPEIALVFMDIKMPVMNGLEATARIKELRPALPVVALTAYAQSGDRTRMLEAGCDDYIPKPLSREKVTEMLNKYKLV